MDWAGELRLLLEVGIKKPPEPKPRRREGSDAVDQFLSE
jgi:hypothetical protein